MKFKPRFGGNESTWVNCINLAFTSCNWSRKFLYMCKLFVWDVCMTRSKLSKWIWLLRGTLQWAAVVWGTSCIWMENGCCWRRMESPTKLQLPWFAREPICSHRAFNVYAENGVPVKATIPNFRSFRASQKKEEQIAANRSKSPKRICRECHWQTFNI